MDLIWAGIGGFAACVLLWLSVNGWVRVKQRWRKERALFEAFERERMNRAKTHPEDDPPW